MIKKKEEEIAVFRFGVIHEFVGGANLSKSEKTRLMKERCAQKWNIPYSDRTRISRKSIYRWIKCYQDSGGKIESLFPKKRCDQGLSRKLDDETIAIITNIRKEQLDLAVPLFLAKLKNENQAPRTTSLSNLYRLLHAHNLMEKSGGPEDRRKYEASMPNDIWQSDVMHGPKVLVDQRNRKTYLIAFLDDHSRLIIHAGFYLSEGLVAFMDSFEKALAKRGLPRKLYVDNGAAYRSHQLEFTCASLAIALIHARPYKPQGKGKIERFFRTIRASFLPTADASSLASLNQSLTEWLENTYHPKKHSATGMTPFHRFTRKLSCIRPAPKDLRDHFRKTVHRKVAKDRTITLDGNLFEAPVELIGKRVLLLYHANELERIEVLLNGKSYGFLVPVDLNVNCRVKRDKNENTEIQATTEPAYQGGSLWK